MLWLFKALTGLYDLENLIALMDLPLSREAAPLCYLGYALSGSPDLAPANPQTMKVVSTPITLISGIVTVLRV